MVRQNRIRFFLHDPRSIAVATKSNNWLYFVRSIWLVYRPARPTTSWLSTSVCSSILKVSRWNAIKLIYELLDINSCHAYARNIIDHLGEACWWTVHPASKQRSEGEKVRVGDDLILVSVATERYLVSNMNEITFLLQCSNDHPQHGGAHVTLAHGVCQQSVKSYICYYHYPCAMIQCNLPYVIIIIIII